MNSRRFWHGMMVGALGLLAFGASLWLLSPWKVAGAALTGVVLGLHAGELPLALRVSKMRGVGAARAVAMNMLFGFTWWLPLRRRIF